jgi:hypothetical protein
MRRHPVKIRLLLILVVFQVHIQLPGVVVVAVPLSSAVEETKQQETNSTAEIFDALRFQHQHHWEDAIGLSNWNWWWSVDKEEQDLLHERWSELEEFLQYRKEQAEADMKDFWMYHHERAKADAKFLHERLKEIATQVERDVLHHKDQMEHDIQALEESFQAESLKLEHAVHKSVLYIQTHIIENSIFRQRQGLARVYKSFQNFLGVLAGVTTTFWTNPTLAKVSISLQSAGLARLLLPKERSAIRDVASLGVLSISFMAAHREEKKKQLQAISSLQHTRPASSTHFLYKWLPPATLAAAVCETALEILKHCQEQELQEEGNRETAKNRTTTVAILWVSTALPIFLSLYVLPPRWSVMAAASLAGAKLLLDSASDEIVGNWMRMVRHMGQSRLKWKLGERVYQSIRRRLERKVLYPAREALEELEAAIANITQQTSTGSYQKFVEILRHMGNSSSNRPDKEALDTNGLPTHLVRNIKDAVARSLRLRMRWFIAAAGMISQMVLPRALMWRKTASLGTLEVSRCRG